MCFGIALLKTSKNIQKNVCSGVPFKEEVNPQITISESTKSGGEKLIFSRFTQIQLQIHDGTENRLNTLSHRIAA